MALSLQAQSSYHSIATQERTLQCCQTRHEQGHRASLENIVSPRSIAKVLIAICYASLHHFHPHIVPPVVTQLAGPLKVCGVCNVCVHQLLDHISSMHIQSDQCSQGQAILPTLKCQFGPCNQYVPSVYCLRRGVTTESAKQMSAA